uniref:PPM-type phosphatase domain-containing protein n=1 Tax=Amphimedon queenslandica TaxID=400682 RepID=A0A1X7VX08_AMPQE
MTVSLLFIKGSQVFVANVGDSDIVMAIKNEKYGQREIDVIEFVEQKRNGKEIGLLKEDYDVCEGLVYEALEKNSTDNISLILVTVDRIIDTEVVSNDNDCREVPDIADVRY